jgi:hypothetical protein
MRIPIDFKTDRGRVEQILLGCARKATEDIREVSEPVKRRLEDKYFITVDDMTPRVYYRITDNWVEMTVRFIVRPHGARDVKDAMSRMILDEFDRAGIGIASGTYSIVNLPPVRVEMAAPANQRDRPKVVNG